MLHIASFWNFIPRWLTGGKCGISLCLTYGNHSAVWSQYSMTLPAHAHAWTLAYVSHSRIYIYLYSFWILVQDGRLPGISGFPIWKTVRSHSLVLWRCNMSCMLMRIYVVPYWCTFSYLDPMIQDGRLAGNLAFSILDIKQLSHSYSSVLWRCSMSHMLMRIVCDALLVQIILPWS